MSMHGNLWEACAREFRAHPTPTTTDDESIDHQMAECIGGDNYLDTYFDQPEYDIDTDDPDPWEGELN
jgi:hypothetical protein